MTTKRQRKAEQRIERSLTKREWDRFSDKVVDQIIEEVGLPDQASSGDGKETENDENGDDPMQMPLRKRLKLKLGGFAYDYFHDALLADPPTRDFFKNIVQRSRALLEALGVQTEDGKKFLPIRTLSLLELGGQAAIEDSVVPAHLKTVKDDETRFLDLWKELTSVIDVIQTLEISARYAGKKAKLKNKTSSLNTNGRMNEDDEILFRLAHIYSECWNEKAGYKKDPAGEVFGPFVQFVTAVLRELEEPITPKSIASRIDRLKKSKMLQAINPQVT